MTRSMDLFFWKNKKKIDTFAKALAEDLFSYIQPEVAKQHFQGVLQKNKKKNRKVEQKLAGIFEQMQKYSNANSLGVYGKARLQKAFSDRMLELGYDVAVINKLVEAILLRNL